jgi:tRNA-dihydrouridine synthase 3
MALSTPLLQSQKTEWALVRAHPSESHRHTGPENASYGVQIAGSKVANVVKTTELLNKLCGDGIDTIDLNCGCPLDMVYKTGAGSGLLDQQGKLVKMLRGMMAVSGDIPVSCKIRMGVQTGKNTATKLLKKIILENVGISAVTLHGRSRQQRYTKAADWEYIAECAALIKRTKEEMAAATDSSLENLEVGQTQRLAFLGNGDVNSYVDWERAIDGGGVDTCMIARGAIIKPWIFEEIEARQHLDKSATERLEMLRTFAYRGLEHWVLTTHLPTQDPNHRLFQGC